VPCSVVFGVKTKPFKAHAWVQSGNMSLNEPCEKSRTFAPIFSF
jgi:hypothetical protein